MIVVEIPGLIQISQLASFLGGSDAFYSDVLLWHKAGFHGNSAKMQATYETVFICLIHLIPSSASFVVRIVLLTEIRHS